MAETGACRELAGLALLVAILSLGAHLAAGPVAVPPLGGQRLLFVFAVTLLYLLLFALVLLLHSLRQLPGHVDAHSRQVRLRPLWRAVGADPRPGAVAVGLAAYGVTASSNLAEIYRQAASTWFDPLLWQAEREIFALLLGSWLDKPIVWDIVYFQMWSFVLLVAALLGASGQSGRLASMAMAIVIAFFITRGINLLLPSAGPAFFRPERFHLDGTASRAAQLMLIDYMAGRIPANGVYPATMAMPSLHVALTALAAGFLACGRRRTLWWSLPWLGLVWASTVMLGWHYLADGLAGLGVAALAAALAAALQWACRNSAWNPVFRLRPRPEGLRL